MHWSPTAWGLLGLILVKVLAPGFYARQNIKTPVKIAVITLTATQLMNLAFIVPLQTCRTGAGHRFRRMP